MLRRLHSEQPDSFAFTPANQAWAEAQITKYPEGRQASAIIPLLWRAQEQEGWLTRPAIEHVSDMLGMAYIRGLEVASFYFMFQLQPVGSVAHIQVCGTTSCMICGAEDLVAVCKDKIAPKAHQLSADGKFSWEEVECLGSCANAPMAQIGKDYYEDLTAARMGEIIDELAAGNVPTPGPQNGRYAAEPLAGLTSLKNFDSGHTKYNASVQLATDIGDTVKRIDGTEVPLITPWQGKAANASAKPKASKAKTPKSEAATSVPKARKPENTAKPKTPPAKAAKAETSDADAGTKPATLTAARGGTADDLKMIKGVGPKLESLLHSLGFYHFDQIAAWKADEVAWVDQNLQGFKGRVSRDNWVTQAKALASGSETEFSQRAKKDGIYKE
ncbi:NADH-quinone oxidoreductase subunit E [Tateyamaria sp. SN3-11]|uniref:NADH-quinone oxidoreductase subunit E n=1 Tax=Tateyamaria sp. SN3-11 TaxID=3092147 RepID=UPI0039EB62D3